MVGGELTTLVGSQSRLQRIREHRQHHARHQRRALRWWHHARQWQVSPQPTSGPSSSPIALERMAASPSSATERGTTTSMVTSAHQTPLLWGKLLAPLHPWDLGVVAWYLPRTSEWWSSRASSGPTYQINMTGASTPPSSCRSTPPPSLV
jgi:hypothetical protein